MTTDRPMRYASVCDGIGAVHVAWQPLGWECTWTSEIAPFPSAVVEQRWGFRNFGDMTAITEEQIADAGPVDVLVGGTPCQPFSIQGRRKGLDDDRGNLALQLARLADRLRPRWLLWENVPGVLSSNGGKDFAGFLWGLAECGYFGAWRVLDARYFGIAQRRRRVFAVFCLGDWRDAAAVLLEHESLCCPAGPHESGEVGVSSRTRCKTQSSVAYGLTGDTTPKWGKEVMPTLRAEQGGEGRCVVTAAAVRRLTPIEQERLFGLPDDYTNVVFRGKDASAASRSRAIGNSIAVPCLRWLGQRIELVEKVLRNG